MNDTETEARRLLAVATEDMPPGIDLLGGFVAARRRDRTRRTRGRIVLSAGAAAAAALGTAVALTISSAPPALATVTSALTRTLAQSYHLREGACTTRADPVRHLKAVSCSNGMALREVGSYTYRTGGRHTIPGHPGKTWERTPTACSDRMSKLAINGFTAATPQQMLSEIKKVGKVTVVGPASGPRWTGTRYAFSRRHGSLLTISGTVDVDQQGRARNLALTIGLDSRPAKSVIKQVLTFSDFGAPVKVTPPPADQTFVLARHC